MNGQRAVGGDVVGHALDWRCGQVDRVRSRPDPLNKKDQTPAAPVTPPEEEEEEDRQEQPAASGVVVVSMVVLCVGPANAWEFL